MISSYITLALRHLIKNRLYAFINIMGLALGLCVFLLSSILVVYEKDHDHVFTQRENIYTVGSVFSPESGISVSEYPNARLAYGPLFNAEIEDALQVTRSIRRQRVLSVESGHYYKSIRFVDLGFTKIFDFRYLHGGPLAIEPPHGLIITASTALEMFGRTDVIGEAVSLEHKYLMSISAVIEDVPADSHFNSSFLPDSELTVIAPIGALIQIENFSIEGEWLSHLPSDLTYILLPEDRNQQWLQIQVDRVAARHTPAHEGKFISALKVRPLVEFNTAIWESLGFPLLESIRLLGILVLIAACVNYANLGTAQSFARTREVGLRKALGANRSQLLSQFLIESLTTTTFAMLLALTSIEILVPIYNSWTDKTVALDYINTLPWLVLTTLCVGLLAGAYPAYLAAQLKPINCLSQRASKGPRGRTLRNFLVATQFAISIFILAMVTIIYCQNVKVRDTSDTFLKTPTVVLEHINRGDIAEKHQRLRKQLSALHGVEIVSFSSAVPYSGMDRWPEVTSVLTGDSPTFNIGMVSIDANFMKLYNIKLIDGRFLDSAIDTDVLRESAEQVNVVINSMAAHKLGFNTETVIGKSFYSVPDGAKSKGREYTIVGLMPNHYFNGAHTNLEPLGFFIQPQLHSFASIRLHEQSQDKTVEDIDRVWAEVVENYPIRRSTLDSYFDFFFRIPQGINNIFAAFAGVALTLAFVGLFGLAVFMAKSRTMEIGIRKVMGANVIQIIGLLTWQFSLPLTWSLLVAMPSAYIVSNIYLDFFPVRIVSVVPAILLASVVAVLGAWAIIVVHAINVTKATPAKSLRS